VPVAHIAFSVNCANICCDLDNIDSVKVCCLRSVYRTELKVSHTDSSFFSQKAYSSAPAARSSGFKGLRCPSRKGSEPMLYPARCQGAFRQLADEAAALQAKVNLQIGWSMIIGRSISPELYDANAHLVAVARQLHEIARQEVEDEAFRQVVSNAERVAARGVRANGD
jgi:hypothetical protein